MGCPHQCVFCNQTSITGSNPKVFPGFITEIINEISEKVALRSPAFQGAPYDQLRAQRGNRLRREIAFYGGSFTGMDKKVQMQLLSAVQPFIQRGLIDSVRVSTRPDYIDPQTLHVLREYGVKTVELGVQSMVEDVLRCSKRGHTADDVLKAVELLHGGGFEVGIQIMVGLPGDDARGYAHTVDRVTQLNPHFVRIYPTLVLKGTLLEKWYRSGRYRPLSVKEAVDLCKGAFLKFYRAGIPVIRLGLQSSPELETQDCVVAGPYHPAFGHLVESSLFYDMASFLIGRSGQYRILRARISPSDLSNFRGQKNQNLDRLRREFGLRDVRIEVDKGRSRGSLTLINGRELNEISYWTLPVS
jgi:histone acetyltransferase (RNA polymerase elongator complex component)